MAEDEDEPKFEVERAMVTKPIVAPSRRGRSSLTVWLNPAIVKQTKIAALTVDKSVQDFVEQALLEAIKKAGI